MKVIKCKNCNLLDVCPSGQRMTELVKDFARFCPVGKERKEEKCKHEWIECGQTVIGEEHLAINIGWYRLYYCKNCGEHRIEPYKSDKQGHILNR